ncbi:MAG: TetR/AcrR family transcriptional regulator [Myxococcales bacterium]|nr:TetR/AcrR family transcriptional regulator [Myxococcales bacterium]
MPKVVDHEERQNELAQAALETLAREGVAGTTMRSVAETAGCTTGMLVHYFANKDAILIAALRCAQERTAARMRAVLNGPDTPGILSRFLAEALPLDAVRRQEWSIWLAFWGGANASPQLAGEHRARYREYIGAVRRVLSIAVERGELAEVARSAEEAEALAAFIDGLGLQAMLDPGRLPRRRQLALLETYIARLRAS